MTALHRPWPHRWTAFFLASVLGLLSPFAANRAPGADKPAAPNVVVIFTDDQGYGDLGCYGAQGFETPHIDRLAREGVRFTDFYVAQAVCSASRTALLTGCYPNRVGILGALNPASKNGIHDNETTIAEVLKQRSYATAIYGKWHLGHHPQFLPTRHGFDDYFGLPYSNDMRPTPANPKYAPLPLIAGEKTIAANPDQTQLTTQYTEHAVRFIAKNKDRPFFLYVPHTMPHVPLFVSNKFAGKSKQGAYGDVIMEIDWSVGEILAALKKHNLDERTLVIFTCDNGPWLTYGNHGGSAGPLREGKGTSWDGGVRVPFIARWPGKVPAGSVCKEPAMTIDLLPTLAKLADAPLPKLPIDGKDIGPLLRGEANAQSPHEALFFYWGRELQAVRSGNWKLHFPHSYRTIKTPGKDGKPGQGPEGKTPLALYDLAKDMGEATNVADQHPDVVKRLQALADQMRAELGDSATKQEGKGVRPPGLVQAAAPAADDAARAIIEKAVKAYGGAEKLAAVKATRIKSKGTVDLNAQTFEFTSDAVHGAAGKLRTDFQLDLAGQQLTVIQVCDGVKAWFSVNGTTEELSGDPLKEQKQQAHHARVSTLAPLLTDKAYTLTPLGEIKVHGKPAVGVKIAAKDQPDLEVYFDATTWLIAKMAFQSYDRISKKEVAREVFPSDYKEAGGVKYAGKLLIHLDGKKFIESEVTDCKFADAVDDSEFAKP